MTIKEIISTDKAQASLSAMGFSDPARALGNLLTLSDGPLAAALDTVTELVLASPSPTMALNNLERLTGALPPELLERALATTDKTEALVTLCGSSELLVGSVMKHPEFFEALFFGGELQLVKKADVIYGELKEAVSGITDPGEAAMVLRIYKQREFLRIGLRDLLGLADLQEVTASISDLAGASLDAAFEVSLNELKARFGAPIYTDINGNEKEAEFTIIGMGKLGGRELNFSSDIDIIFIYETEEGETAGVEGRPGSGTDFHSFFVKLSTKVSKLINDVTEEGFIFRVDLDLRPDGRSGAMACSLGSAETYYESWGRTWERSAMIKARPVAGSTTLGGEFLKMIEPFVFRKYLDFTTVEEIKEMKEQVDLALLKRSPGTIDVKLGEGGIREIEFFCQALQLIHGGTAKEIREKGTLNALINLNKAKLLDDEAASILRDGYIFLRNTEHRIQIVEGRQTQAIPARDGEVRRLAKMMGFKKEGDKAASRAFMDEYEKITGSVYEIYRSLFYDPSEEISDGVDKEFRLLLTPDSDDEETIERLKNLGFSGTEEVLGSIKFFRDFTTKARLNPRGRLIFEKLVPFMLKEAAATPNPIAALSYLARFTAAIPAKTTFFALLFENPRVTELLVKIFGSSEFLARTLIDRPGAVDNLLAKDLSTPVKSKAELKAELGVLVYGASAGDFEGKLNALRRFKAHEFFRIGVNDLKGGLEPSLISAQMSSLAECALDAAIEISAGELGVRFGAPSGDACFSILGLGKLGAGELGFGSDLDLIFVYSDQEAGAVTDGKKEISNAEYFVKLGQKIISVLTIRTNEGVVFPVDMRLRPSGSSGPLVISKTGFLNYQEGKAELWETQALIKARPAAGDKGFGRELEEALQRIIYSREPGTEDISTLLKIRERMEKEIAKESEDKYNIKTGLGGLVDIEFLAQIMQLKYASKYPSLMKHRTASALEALKDSGLISTEDYGDLSTTYSMLRGLEHNLRIVYDSSGVGAGEGGMIVRGTPELEALARSTGFKGSGDVSASVELLGDYLKRRTKVRELYLKYLNAL